MSIFVYDALQRARDIVEPVIATERGEDKRRDGSTREFSYPSAAAVEAAARAAMKPVRLLLIVRQVGPSIIGAQGHELLPIVFGLVHADSGDVIEFKVAQPLADPSEFIGRPQAQAATITTAQKHLLLQLLSIEIVAPTVGTLTAAPAVKHGKLDAVGPMPDWATHWATHNEAPAHLAHEFRMWQARDLADRTTRNPGATSRTWPELVARVLVCEEPRTCRSSDEEDAVARFMDLDSRRLEAGKRVHTWTSHDDDRPRRERERETAR